MSHTSVQWSVATAVASILLGCGESGSRPISLEPGVYEIVATCNGLTLEEQVSVRLQTIEMDARLDGEACNGSGGDAGDSDARLVFLCIDAEIGLADFAVRCFEEESIVCTGQCREADGGTDLVEADEGGVVVLERLAAW